MQAKRTPTGIRARHSKSCTPGESGNCSCSPNWEAWVFLPREKKKIRKTFPTQAAAKAWRADAQVALRKGTLRLPSNVTLREAAENWLKGAKAGLIRTRSGDLYKPSARAYQAALRQRILPALGAARLSEIKRVDLQDLVEELLGEGLAASTIRNVVMPLRSIYRRAISRGEATVNPTVGLELPAVRSNRDRIASPREAAKLLDVLQPEDRALWAAALYAGLRRGELQALRWKDIDLEAGVIRVERSWDDKERIVIEPKSRAGRRSVPIPSVLRGLLIEHRLRSGRHDGLVFGAGRERPFCPSAFSRRAQRAWLKRGLRPITLHEGRHTFASLMIAAGVNAKALSSYMGHSSVSITYDRYGHLMPGNENESVSLLDRYLAKGQRGPIPMTERE